MSVESVVHWGNITWDHPLDMEPMHYCFLHKRNSNDEFGNNVTY